MSRHFFGESEAARRERICSLKAQVEAADYRISGDKIAAALLGAGDAQRQATQEYLLREMALVNASEAMDTLEAAAGPTMTRHFLQERLALLLAKEGGEEPG